MDLLDVLDTINRIADNRNGREITGGSVPGLTESKSGQPLLPARAGESGSVLPGSFLQGDSDEHDTVFVKPVPGSVVYCDLGFGFIEHSGIYIGNGRIVALERDGRKIHNFSVFIR